MSARDVQLPKTQFYEAKSYPTFTPVGPALVLLDADELQRFGDLRLQLRVNGELRQNAIVAGDMIYRPLRALQELTRFQRMDVGDLLLTGTPVGTALSAPPKPIEIIGSLLPPAVKWKAFFKRRPRTRSTCTTATSSRPASPPTTRRSTSARSARWSDTHDRSTGVHTSPSSSSAPAPPASPPPPCWRSTASSACVLDRWARVYPQPRAVHLDDEVFRILGPPRHRRRVRRDLPSRARAATASTGR